MDESFNSKSSSQDASDESYELVFKYINTLGQTRLPRKRLHTQVQGLLGCSL